MLMNTPPLKKINKIRITIVNALFCSTPRHYKLAMHVFGRLACSTTLKDMEEIIASATVVFSSPCNGNNFAKHYQHLLELIKQSTAMDDTNVHGEDYKVILILRVCDVKIDLCPTFFPRLFKMHVGLDGFYQRALLTDNTPPIMIIVLSCMWC